MKKFYIFIVGLIMSLSLAGCNNKQIKSLEFSPSDIVILKGSEIENLKATPIYNKDKKGDMFDIKSDMISNFDKNKTGTQKVTIKYMGFETEIDIFVADKIVSNETELREAINNQKDGEAIALKAGTYDIKRDDTRVYLENTNYYFLITANNSTWKGFGDVIVKSSLETENGALSTQNFVTIAGDNVTFENINLQCKKEANKVIEIYGKETTIRNLTIKPIDDTYNFAGSIYLSTPTGKTTIENVKLQYGRITTSGAGKEATLTLKDVTIDFAGSTNKSGDAEISLWGFMNTPKITVTATNSTVSVSSTFKAAENYQTFVDQLPKGLTVVDKKA